MLLLTTNSRSCIFLHILTFLLALWTHDIISGHLAEHKLARLVAVLVSLASVVGLRLLVTKEVIIKHIFDAHVVGAGYECAPELFIHFYVFITADNKEFFRSNLSLFNSRK